MCDQAKACSRASLPAGGLKPESPPEAGARVTDFEKKNGFRLHIPPPSAKKSSFFQYTNFSWKIPGKKKKSHRDSCCPVLLGDFQLQMKWVCLALPSSLSNGQFLVHNQTGNSLAGTRVGLHKLPPG